MPFCSNCGQQLTVETEKFCSNCGQNLKTGGVTKDNIGDSINIQGTGGSVIGAGVRGSGNIIGENIVVGSGTINLSQQELSKIPIPEYASALKEFSQSINEQLKGKQIPKEQVQEINNNLNELAKEVQDVKPEEKVSMIKQKTVNSKFSIFAAKVLKVLPKTAETIAGFTPLAPFSKIIGESVQDLVEALQKDI